MSAPPLIAQPQATTIDVSLMTNFLDDWRAFEGIFSEFEAQHPGIKIVLHAYEDSRQRKLNQKSQAVADLAFVQLNRGHCQAFEQGELGAISQQWKTLHLDRHFTPGMKQVVSCNDNIVAIPMGYYTWGFLYHKPFFKQHNLTEPDTWQDFIKLLSTIKQRTNKAPINLGSKDFWATAVWFDYLNLRSNGYEFHKSTLEGKVPFTDERLINVFNYWRELTANGMFLTDHDKLGWDDAYGFFLQGETQLILGSTNVSGSYERLATQDLIGYFSFPRITPDIAVSEEIPLDAFVFSPSFLASSHAPEMIKFLSSAQVHQTLAHQLNYYPANTQTQHKGMPLHQKIHAQISGSQNFTRFFDRDTDIAFADKATQIFRQFMLDHDVTKATAALELLRIEVFDKH